MEAKRVEKGAEKDRVESNIHKVKPKEECSEGEGNGVITVRGEGSRQRSREG